MKIRDISKYPVLSEGGEGILYENWDTVLKWYKPGVNLEAKRRKIEILMKARLPEEVVRPLEELTDRRGRFAGYRMKKVLGEEFRMLSNKKFTSANGITTRDILGMLVQIKKALDELHSSQIWVGDLNDRNILFDSQHHIYLIDCDSWTVGTDKCEVAQELFQDPLLSGNDFDEKTDTYAFCILAWKALTRVHPFGGSMDPDLNPIERMGKGLSVIDRPSVKLPRTVKPWKNLSPELISVMKEVFEQGRRSMGAELEKLLQGLKYCASDQEYYDGRYMTCPLCDVHARIRKRPVSCGVLEGLILTAVWNRDEIRTVLNEGSYIDQEGAVTHVQTGRKVPYLPGRRYYFTADGTLITENKEQFRISGKEDYFFDKKFNSSIAVEENRICYLNKQSSLCEVIVHPAGNSIRKLCQCGNAAYFEAKDQKYCVVNIYDNQLIVHADGYHLKLSHKGKVINYGIHHDAPADSWLIVLECVSGSFRTLVISGGSVLYDTDQIRYPGSLNHLCISNQILYMPADGRIRGYAYQRDQFKDFVCELVDADSKLIKKGRRFLILNNENLYYLE